MNLDGAEMPAERTTPDNRPSLSPDACPRSTFLRIWVSPVPVLAIGHEDD
jgi:hypothetical protein